MNTWVAIGPWLCSDYVRSAAPCSSLSKTWKSTTSETRYGRYLLELGAAVHEPTSAAPIESENRNSREEASSREQVEIERLTKLTSQLTSEVAHLEQMRLETEKFLADLDRLQIA